MLRVKPVDGIPLSRLILGSPTVIQTQMKTLHRLASIQKDHTNMMIEMAVSEFSHPTQLNENTLLQVMF
jgi:hypothetical protein